MKTGPTDDRPEFASKTTRLHRKKPEECQLRNERNQSITITLNIFFFSFFFIVRVCRYFLLKHRFGSRVSGKSPTTAKQTTFVRWLRSRSSKSLTWSSSFLGFTNTHVVVFYGCFVLKSLHETNTTACLTLSFHDFLHVFQAFIYFSGIFRNEDVEVCL